MFDGLDTRKSFQGRHTSKLLSDTSGTIIINPATDRWCEVTLTGTGRTLAFTSIPPVGWTGLLFAYQDATGSRTITTYPSFFSWMGGTAPTLTTTASKTDIISLVSNGRKVFAAASLNG